MCTGMEVMALASAAATVGGGVVSHNATQDKIDAQRKAAMAEAMRQDEFDKEKFGNFEEALQMAGKDRQQGNIDDATQSRAEDIGSNVGLPGEGGAYVSPASSAPKVVQTYADEREAEADDFVSQIGNARARMGAWDEGQFDFGKGFSDLAWRTGELNRRAGRSGQIGVNEAKMAGMQAGNGKALTGNILTGLGQAGMGYAGNAGAFDDLFGATNSVSAVNPALPPNFAPAPKPGMNANLLY